MCLQWNFGKLNSLIITALFSNAMALLISALYTKVMSLLKYHRDQVRQVSRQDTAEQWGNGKPALTAVSDAVRRLSASEKPQLTELPFSVKLSTFS